MHNVDMKTAARIPGLYQFCNISRKDQDKTIYCYIDENERITIITNNRNILEIRQAVAQNLGISTAKVRVICQGNEIRTDWHFEAETVCAALCREMDGPVTLNRSEELEKKEYSRQEADCFLSVSTRLEEDGSILILTSAGPFDRNLKQELIILAAEQFDVAPEMITIRMGDTDYPQAYNIEEQNIKRLFTKAAGVAALRMQEQIREEAALRLDCLPQEICICQAGAYCEGRPKQIITLRQIGIESMFGPKKILAANGTAVLKKKE